MIVSTGSGGAVVVNAQVLTGPHGIAGEWGHNPLPWPTDDERPGPSCYCGKQGCVETFLSGPWLQLDYQQHSGQQRSAREIVQLAQQGDVIAEHSLQR